MTKFNPEIHHRHSIRVPGYDYSQAGLYFITIVAQERECLFGEVVNSEMKLSLSGKIVQNTWFDLPKHYLHVKLDAFCVMPDHVHGIIVLNANDSITRQPLSEIVRAFKSFSARSINTLRKTPGIPVWQRNYYEHIIRNNEDYRAKSSYIQCNSLNWEKDDEY